MKYLAAVTVFLSAFLLFQVQPLLAKYILPWFGGSPAVWTTCMLFFQVMLVAGYAYAHILVVRLGPALQRLVHLGLILVALFVLPLSPGATWKPVAGDDPTCRILALLTLTVGLPYLLLSATTPLVQSWLSRADGKARSYRLYAVSNAGALVALITYPSLVEPTLSSDQQSRVWSLAFAVCAGLLALCLTLQRPPLDRARLPSPSEPVPAAPGARRQLLWLALACTASVMFLAVTNQLCRGLAAAPFLWVVPLALYLLSYIIAFDGPRWYRRGVFLPLLAAGLAGMTLLLLAGIGTDLLLQAAGYSLGLFACCMVCHGELARLKPPPRYLTRFYLMVAIGGASGGVFVAVGAPLLFRGYFELHMSLVAVALLTLALLHEDPGSRLRGGKPVSAWAMLVLGFCGLSVGLTLDVVQRSRENLAITRSFHGVLRVGVSGAGLPGVELRSLYHGDIVHGFQYSDPGLRLSPTAYYDERSGVGVALNSMARGHGLRLGIVGLGIGTLASYGHAGDELRFYEIDPQVEALARQYFSYLSESPAHTVVILGDARLSLEREPPQLFDALVLDAFNGDAIPVHLLTREAFQTYLRHLRPDGVLLVNTSNRFLYLDPLVYALAQELGLDAVSILSEADERRGALPSSWMVLSRDRRLLSSDPIRSLAVSVAEPPRLHVWTDAKNDLLRVAIGSHRMARARAKAKRRG